MSTLQTLDSILMGIDNFAMLLSSVDVPMRSSLKESSAAWDRREVERVAFSACRPTNGAPSPCSWDLRLARSPGLWRFSSDLSHSCHAAGFNAKVMDGAQLGRYGKQVV
jgi:hypothetical protein